VVDNILRNFPSVEQMSQAKDFTDMKNKMDKSHPYAYSFLNWIITSNRSHLVKLPEAKRIKSMVTAHQYLLLSAPPEKEAKFRQLKEKHGSCFAFHGSSIENWHSILRQGLKNASGTKLQMNGAAYGQGIYLSPHSATSFGYCRMVGGTTPTKSGNRFLDSTNVNCIAICEVINDSIRKSGSIWVQPHEDHVVTRFFFVYTNINETTNAQAVNCEDQKYVKEIQGAMS